MVDSEGQIRGQAGEWAPEERDRLEPERRGRRRSPRAQVRRQEEPSGPLSEGEVPLAARWRADHQSVVASSANAATAVSMRP
ncbi:MAG: hypothetical protein M3N37_03725, partial [Actinomycetota bacterium]|nr:hypothetical protein [Actinomycetota bacterium]